MLIIVAIRSVLLAVGGAPFPRRILVSDETKPSTRFNVPRLRVTWIVHHLSVGTHLTCIRCAESLQDWVMEPTAMALP